jgi:hypothetical protein
VRARLKPNLTKNIAAALPDRDHAALWNCFTPNPAAKAIAITDHMAALGGTS